MAAYHRVDDLRSPAVWLPIHRDQLRAQRSVSSMGKPLPFALFVYIESFKDGYVCFSWQKHHRFLRTIGASKDMCSS